VLVFAFEPSPNVPRSPAKVGGEPLPPGPAIWPACAKCGKPMRFLFQLPHRTSVLLDFAPAASVLVFQCENPDTVCMPFDPDSGANRVLAVARGEPAKMTGGPSAQGAYPDIGIAFIRAEEDSAALSLDENAATEAQIKARERAMEDAAWSKAGGVPIWPQSDATPSCCGERMHFVAQVHSETFGLSFGDGGTGYLFRCARSCATPYKFLSQGY